MLMQKLGNKSSIRPKKVNQKLKHGWKKFVEFVQLSKFMNWILMLH